MKNILIFLNILISFIVILLILIQGRGAGLGSAWGGGGEYYQTRRGIEKITFKLTMIVIFFFFLISIINFFIYR